MKILVEVGMTEQAENGAYLKCTISREQIVLEDEADERERELFSTLTKSVRRKMKKLHELNEVPVGQGTGARRRRS